MSPVCRVKQISLSKQRLLFPSYRITGWSIMGKCIVGIRHINKEFLAEALIFELIYTCYKESQKPNMEVPARTMTNSPEYYKLTGISKYRISFNVCRIKDNQGFFP